jgi:hypothetical protein
MVTVAFTPTGSGEGMACSICGCLVDSKATDKHVSFHESIARLLGIVED